MGVDSLPAMSCKAYVDFFGADGELRIEPHVPGFAVSMRHNVVQYLPFVLDSALSGMQDPERWKESTELAVD